MDASDKHRLQSIITKAVRLGLLPISQAPLSKLCEHADQALFSNIVNNHNHVLHNLLPALKITGHDLRKPTRDRHAPHPLYTTVPCTTTPYTTLPCTHLMHNTMHHTLVHYAPTNQISFFEEGLKLMQCFRIFIITNKKVMFRTLASSMFMEVSSRCIRIVMFSSFSSQTQEKWLRKPTVCDIKWLRKARIRLGWIGST